MGHLFKLTLSEVLKHFDCFVQNTKVAQFPPYLSDVFKCSQRIYHLLKLDIFSTNFHQRLELYFRIMAILNHLFLKQLNIFLITYRKWLSKHYDRLFKKKSFFFYQGFFSRSLTTHRTAGEGRGPSLIPLYHFHPLTNIQTFTCNFAREMTITYF